VNMLIRDTLKESCRTRRQ